MSRCAYSEELEDLVLGTLAPNRARLVRAHAQGCPRCAAELAELRRHRELFARRARSSAVHPPDLSAIFAGIDGKRMQVRAARRPGFALGAVLAAAAALLLAWSGLGPLHSSAVADPGWQAQERVDVEVSGPSETCEPMSCSSDSVLACEPVTCAPPVLFAQSGPADCAEWSWMPNDPCVSRQPPAFATP